VGARKGPKEGGNIKEGREEGFGGGLWRSGSVIRQGSLQMRAPI